ncbi:acyltransferase family protein [Sphingomonas sp. HITSZ_GF]|uniref:acyltransferase family protein n=1 Tax=Sphingomonas sp. HITSZ_GF TaxID=3037247 RepID=UPI00240DA506|nr:acyltransferase family protein [Sphingomonas sp. HITSZ_GF]MDG2533793.1 acyltransferase family protein [Sphingomonas sp. HITSZ_GF]
MQGERIAGLDNWRALLMLAGLFLHATMVQEADIPLFDLIARISANFRMGAFFAVAGLLSLYAIRKRGADAWLARRSFQIGVPTAFGLFVLAPLMSVVLSWHWYGSLMPPLPALGWWHFWFLVDLLLYAPITWWIYRADRAQGIFARIDAWAEQSRPSVTLTILSVGGVSLLLVQAVATAAALAGPWQNAVWTLHQIVSYAPLYLSGLVLAGSPVLLRRVTARTGPALNVLALVFGLCLASRLLPGQGDSLFATPMSPLNLVTTTLCPPAVTVLILRSALLIRETPPMFRRVADAAFTIYMLHFPIILLLDMLLDPLRLDPYAAYALTVGLAGWLSYRAHRVIVRRSPLAALLLNGADPGKARAVAAE